MYGLFPQMHDWSIHSIVQTGHLHIRTNRPCNQTIRPVAYMVCFCRWTGGLFLQICRTTTFSKRTHNGRHGAWLSLICSASFPQRRILMRHPFKGYQTHMLGAFAICSGALYALYVLGYGESPNVHLWLLVMAFSQKMSISAYWVQSASVAAKSVGTDIRGDPQF